MVSYRSARNQANKGATESYRQQSDLIVQCARKCFEEKGVRKTTLVDIAREASMTRELIYYYFSGKPEIITHVLDSYVQDSVETARLWCDTWQKQEANSDKELSREALVSAVASIRRFVFRVNGTQRPMFLVLDETGQRYGISSRMCDEIVRDLGSHPIAQKLFRMLPQLDDKQTVAAFKFVVLGIMSLMECDVSQDDNQIVDMLQALTNTEKT